jgi:hypothetical protein
MKQSPIQKRAHTTVINKPMKMEPVTPTEPKTIKRIVAETPIKKARTRVSNRADM